MGKIDLQKLQEKFTKENIIIIEYYCVNYECYYIKCFLTLCYQFMIVYVPSDYRFHVSESNPVVYNIENKDRGDMVEADDYTKTGVSHDIDLINEEKSASTYQDLKNKYERHITLEAEEEPTTRKMKRQMERLSTPFSRINYTLCLQRGKYFSVVAPSASPLASPLASPSPSAGVSSFLIKRYNKEDMCISYVLSLPQLIQDLDEIAVNINTVGKQFIKIIKRVAFSNLNDISSIPQPQRSAILTKIDEYERHIEEYVQLHTKTLRQERDLQQKGDTTLKGGSSWFGKQDPQKVLRDISQSKIQMVEKGIHFVQHFHKKLLLLEEISFDNNLMINRVEKNFELLAQILL